MVFINSLFFVNSDLQYRMEVTFCDKSQPNDAGFALELNAKFKYDQVATAVSKYLSCDPYRIQFFRAQG